MPRDGFKLLAPHREDCRANGDFIVHEDMTFRLRKNGTRGGSTCWHVFTCNDPRCKAKAGVRWDVLMEIIRDGLASDA